MGSWRGWRRWRGLLALLAVGVLTAACAGGSSPSAAPGGSSPSAAPGSRAPGYSKVLLVVEENRSYSDIVGAADAPYLNTVARRFGSATNYQAGYPAACPSLAGYILLTSGSDQKICDDEPPAAHPLAGDNGS